jgi:hypothetical protein
MAVIDIQVDHVVGTDVSEHEKVTSPHPNASFRVTDRTVRRRRFGALLDAIVE